MGQTESSPNGSMQAQDETQAWNLYNPLSKTLRIEELADADGQRPLLYIYECKIEPIASEQPDTQEVTQLIRQQVVEEGLKEWLEQHQLDSELYVIGIMVRRVYSQFAIGGHESGCCFRREVTVQVPHLVGAQYVLKNESYSLQLERVGGPVVDLRNAAYDQEVMRALISLLFADVHESDSFGIIFDKKRNRGMFYNIADEKHRRVTELTPCLRSCRGLSASIAPLDTQTGLALELAEKRWRFFSPVNMLELLSSHYEFDISAPLSSKQIDELDWELKDVAIEMRLGEDESPRNVHRTSIASVSDRSVREELCDFYDETGSVVGKTTAEKQFEHDFPHVPLKYTHLPCLISPKGRRMPIEMCCIAPGEMLYHSIKYKEKYNPDEMDVRREIFEENCDEFIKRCTHTFKRFGFQLIEFKPIRANARRAFAHVPSRSDNSDWRRR